MKFIGILNFHLFKYLNLFQNENYISAYNFLYKDFTLLIKLIIMDKLKQLVINKKKYYLSDDLINVSLPFFDGCINGRRIIKNKKLTKNDYIYAKMKNEKWVESKGNSYKFDKVLVRKKWIDQNVVNDSNDSEKDDFIDEPENETDNNVDDEINNNDEISMAPGIIELKKSEKMKDNKGNRLEIEIRGTRDHDNCFFRVSDVAKGFRMDNLRHALLHKNSGYQKNIHYRYFYFSQNVVNYHKNKKIKKVKKIKKLFLTYTGLLKVLFSSRNKTVNNFVGWATKTLFTAHLGTKEQKDKLASKLMGIATDVVKEVFNKTSSTLPTLYLLSIGKVKDLRVTLNIGDEYDDDMIVCKGGETEDLTRRINEHGATYGKISGANLCLKWYNYIDPQYTSKAESELLTIFGKMNYRFTHPKYNELIIFSKKDTKIITEQYTNISGKYIGHIKEITNKLKDLENHITLLKKENEIELIKKDRENDLLKKESELLKKENELLRKDIEIMNLKKQIEKKK